MGLFNKKHENEDLGGNNTMINNGVTPNEYGAQTGANTYGAGHAAAGQPHLGYGDSSVPSTLPMPEVPTVPQGTHHHDHQSTVGNHVLHQRGDMNDRYAGANQSGAAAYGTQMSGNRIGGQVPTNAAGNIPSQHAIHDPSRNHQAPLQETQPFEETGIGGGNYGQSNAHHHQHGVSANHHNHGLGANHHNNGLGTTNQYDGVGATHHNNAIGATHQPGVVPSHGNTTTHQHGVGHGDGQVDPVRHHPGHSVVPGRRADETTGPATSQEAHAELKEAKKDATTGKVQMFAGKILSSQTMQAKGQAKVDHADALKAQAHHLGEAERLEKDAQSHRKIAGGDVHHTHLGNTSGAYDDRRRNLA